MAKSSTEYAELMGLRIALSNLAVARQQETSVYEWIQLRIQELENK